MVSGAHYLLMNLKLKSGHSKPRKRKNKNNNKKASSPNSQNNQLLKSPKISKTKEPGLGALALSHGW